MIINILKLRQKSILFNLFNFIHTIFIMKLFYSILNLPNKMIMNWINNCYNMARGRRGGRGGAGNPAQMY